LKSWPWISTRIMPSRRESAVRKRRYQICSKLEMFSLGVAAMVSTTRRSALMCQPEGGHFQNPKRVDRPSANPAEHLAPRDEAYERMTEGGIDRVVSKDHYWFNFAFVELCFIHLLS